MVFVNTNILLLFLTSLTVLAAPASNVDTGVSPAIDDDLSPADASPTEITVMTSTQVNAFTPYTYYASAGFCSPSVTLTWTCGANCNANPGFKPIASGGDGSTTQFWYVGYDPTLKTIIVAHQGTDGSKILPIVTDVDLFLTGLRPDLFPGIPPSIEVHNGFGNAHAMAAGYVLSAVKIGVNTYRTKSVTVVGHSLGAAISLLDAVFLPLHIPGLTVTYYGYGLPRVGNQAFANYVDSALDGRFTRITNLKDPIPTLPGQFLGFSHPSNEAHISEGGAWMRCPGQDNPDPRCSVGDTPNIFEGNMQNHDGPYNGIEIGC